MNFELFADHRKILLSSLIAVLLALMLFARESSLDRLLSPIDKQAEIYLESVLTKTAISYATTRALHAVISLVEGSEINPPFATIGIGKIVAPIKDLLERFSTLLLLATVSAGSQLMFLKLSTTAVASYLISFGLLLAIFSLWFENRAFGYWAIRVLVLGAIFRLAIPLVALSSSLISDHILQDRFDQANSALMMEKEATEELFLSENRDRTLVEKAKEWLSPKELSKKLEILQAKAENMVKSVVTLLMLFVFETIVFPLFSLWVLLIFTKSIFGSFNLKEFNV